MTHTIPGKATPTSEVQEAIKKPDPEHTDRNSPQDYKQREPSRHRQTHTEMNTETNAIREQPESNPRATRDDRQKEQGNSEVTYRPK